VVVDVGAEQPRALANLRDRLRAARRRERVLDRRLRDVELLVLGPEAAVGAVLGGLRVASAPAAAREREQRGRKQG